MTDALCSGTVRLRGKQHTAAPGPALGFVESWEQDFFVNPRGWK